MKRNPHVIGPEPLLMEWYAMKIT